MKQKLQITFRIQPQIENVLFEIVMFFFFFKETKQKLSKKKKIFVGPFLFLISFVKWVKTKLPKIVTGTTQS